MANFKLPKFKAKVSTDQYGDLCADIVDKNNGNITVACEIDEDYESFILAAPDMYEFIETYMGGHPEAEELLTKARGEYND